MNSLVTATPQISGSRSTLNLVPGTLRTIDPLERQFWEFFAAPWVVMVTEEGSRAVWLEEATEELEGWFDVGWLSALNLFAGISMTSSNLCFRLTCDAGTVLVISKGSMVGAGWGNSESSDGTSS